MSEMLESYLDRVMVYANRSDEEAADLRNELQDHLLKKIDDLQAEGLSESDAIYQAINKHGHPRIIGYGLRKRFPLIDIRSHGTARGVIAIGPKAVGIFAFGGTAIGVFACGGFAIGGVALGGFALAAIFAFCGIGVGTFAYGGMVLGVLATGGFASGIVAVGGFAIGLLAEGGKEFSYFNTENAPRFMKLLLGLVRSKGLYLWATIVTVPIMLALVAVTNVFTIRERRRIQNADPWLQE
ncbi:MAG: hypothetical protein KAR11_03035 [Phycisphaerae bacterium]|nr:hypothetical protein [Phycisphaerae bacterium]